MSKWDDSWYDDEDFPPAPNARGRARIVAVAIVTFVMCGFNALCSTCLFFCGFVFAVFGNANGNGNFLPGDLIKHEGVVMLATGLASAVSFVLQIIAGIGLLNGRRWGRTISLYLAGYSAIMSGLLIYLIALALTIDGGNRDDAMGQAVLWFIALAFHAIYATTTLLILLNRRTWASLR